MEDVQGREEHQGKKALTWQKKKKCNQLSPSIAFQLHSFIYICTDHKYLVRDQREHRKHVSGKKAEQWRRGFQCLEDTPPQEEEFLLFQYKSCLNKQRLATAPGAGVKP